MKVLEKISSPSNNCNLHDSERVLIAEETGRDQFESLISFTRHQAQSMELHEVERDLMAKLLNLGRTLLELNLAEKGTGKKEAGSELSTPSGEVLPYHSVKTRSSYLSIFGEVSIPRAYYWKPGAKQGIAPLDAELNLPKERYSYLLQEWGELFGVDGSYQQVTNRMEGILGIKFWSQGVQSVAQTASTNVQQFYEEAEIPDSKTEGEILVATLDGKGVPLRPHKKGGVKLRLGKGEKPNKKKEAIVSAVYSVDPFYRTPEDVVREVDEGNCLVGPKKDTVRPKIQNKRLRATLQGKDAAFAEVKRQLDQRDPSGTMQRVALTDGARSLQYRVLSELGGKSGIVLVLDIMHVLTYLWPVALADHPEGSAEASRWVMNKLRLLLEGKVGYVIGALKQRLNQGRLRKTKRKEIETAIKYMNRNRDYMLYDEYLENGYPIGSGVVEGACKHLVKDRMERTGMRWNLEGAEAMLELRSVELNGNWQEFWRYHVKQQRQHLYELKPIDGVKKVA